MLYSEKNSSELKKIASEITDLLRKNYRNKDGVFIQGRVSDELISNPIIDDFGDVAPFISLYGGEDMCEEHIYFIKNNIDNLGFERAFAYTDLILGLIWYSRIGVLKSEALDLAIELANQVEKRWIKNKKIFSVSYKGVTLPITNGIDSTFLEVWTELYRETREDKYKQLACDTHNYFKFIHEKHSTGLIPLHHMEAPLGSLMKIIYPDKFSGVHVMKDNTNYLFALLDMIRLNFDKDSARNSFDSIHQKLAIRAKDNRLNNVLDSAKKSDLLSSFSFIDLSCDAYVVLGDKKYLDAAKNLADNWLLLPKNNTGLFPRNFDTNDSYFDSETDMAVAFLKLYECTGDIKYKNKVFELLNGILNYHKKENGFILQVDINDGTVTGLSIKTKFVALFIKLLHIISENKSIYKNEFIFMLAKDR